MKAEKTSIGKFLMLLGALLLAAAIILTAYNLWDQSRAKKAAEESLGIIEQMTPEMPADSQFEKPLYELNPNMEMPVVTVDGVDYVGTVYIEQLSIKLPVISEWSYPNLKKAPCRYSGSVYKDSMVIAAHNYRGHFADLEEIQVGATIVFTDMEANEFLYRVVETEILQPSAVEEMISDECDLTLFTCTVSGRTRFTVRCERVEE